MGRGVNSEPAKKDIAIIGMAAYFPGADSPAAFWRRLMAQTDLVTEVPAERWAWRDHYGKPGSKNKSVTRWGGFLNHLDRFDAEFFSITPREANLMDPQQRILLETAWQAIEDAGYRASRLAGTNTGVYIGASHNDYSELIDAARTDTDAYINTGTDSAILSNRISFYFDFRGNSMTVNTGCSSAMVAIHQAVRELQWGECDLALAGGVNICWTPKLFIACSRNGMLSGDGKCKTFDENADGYARSEGAGLILMKPLEQAVRDRDHIHAVIKGVRVNHGGRVSALTVPSAASQADLIFTAYEEAGIAPERVGYIETHGTGTKLGDPIEIHGLKTAFQRLAAASGGGAAGACRCGLGSVKTNVGHLEPAAATAGIIKVIFAMKHGVIPPSLHLRTVNPLIKLKGTGFYLVATPVDWEPCRDPAGLPLPRVAGISSFGFGGSNAHLILEEYLRPEGAAETEADNPRLVILSARNRARLKAYAGKLSEYIFGALENPVHSDALRLPDIAGTLMLGREPFDARLAVVATTVRSLAGKLRGIARGAPGAEDIILGATRDTGEPPDRESMAEILKRRPIGRADLVRLGRYWAAGNDMDWEELFTRRPVRRVPLPTYPFERKRYWVDGRRTEESKETGTPEQETVPRSGILDRITWLNETEAV